MSDGTDTFIPTSRNWQAGRDYGDQIPNTGTMSGGTNNFMPTSRNWQARRDYADSASNTSDWNNTQGSFPRSVSVSFHADPVASRGAPHPRQSFQERMIAEPFGLAGFPVVSHAPLQISVLDPSHRQIIRGSSPGFIHRQNTQGLGSRLNPDEHETALQKLKKEIYTPPSRERSMPKCLYYREDAIKIYREWEKAKENDAMSCAVCLDDFEPKETVMVTPCKHTFHEACIVPWVKSNGHCPVCRFAICKPKRGGASANNTAIAAGDDIQDIMTVIRSLEEAFLWRN